MQPTIPSIFQFASCEGRNHRRPSIGEQQGQDRKKRISHSHWLMELQRQGWLPLLSQQPSNRAVGIVAQAPVFQGLCLKSIRPSKVGDSKTSQCTCGQEHGTPIFLAPPQTGRSQRKGLMGTTTRRARSAGQQCNGGERRRSSFLSRYGLILAQSDADRNGNLFSAPSKSQPSSRLVSPGSPYAGAPMIWQNPQNEKLLKPGCSMTPAPLKRVSASPSKASSGGMQDVHKQRFAPMAENKILTTPCRSFASSLQDYTPRQGTQRERTKPSSRAPPTSTILRSRGVPSGQSPVLSGKTISVHPKYTRERAHTLSTNEPSAPIPSSPPLLSHSLYPGQGNPGDRTPSPLNVKTYCHWQFPSPLTPLASPSIALSSQQENEGLDSSTEIATMKTQQAEAYLQKLQISKQYPHGRPSRGIFCSRTLSLRTITTIGYDMDYTLIHYNVKAWEGRAYEYGLKNLHLMGYPVHGLSFDNDLVIRGLILDKEKGNLVKADRFGQIKRAMHGTKMLSSHAISEIYGEELVNLRNDSRWEFLNTLFSISESVICMQMVERLDNGALPPELGEVAYETLFQAVSTSMLRAHVEGQLKAEVINDPDKFVERDAELPLALLDQKESGKTLLLITNSDYLYTEKMMAYAFDPYLPLGMNWRGLFDMVIVSARKPEFFQRFNPLYEIITKEGLMRACTEPTRGGLYSGGSAFMVEKALGSQVGQTLYVGDHIYTDVSVSKVNLRWRTALICRELEREVKALIHGRSHRAKLMEMISKKELVSDVFNQLQLALQRRNHGHPAQTLQATYVERKELVEEMHKLSSLMGRLDQKIAPMMEADGALFNQRWGYLSRAGLWDKSHLTRQIEKYADIYTSRVSNFCRYSPFMYFRSQTQKTYQVRK
ncbi:unnamed protein product [Sphagnum compactum]